MTGQEHDFTRPDDSTLAISIGKGRATTSFPGSKLSLSFIGGFCAGRSGLDLTKSSITIGRDDECDIVLDGETVSRRHCEIIRWGRYYLLKDESRNGTFVNDHRVVESQLSDGDQIRIGQNILLVKLSSGTPTNIVTGKMTTPQSVPLIIEIEPHIVVKGLEEGVTQSFDEEQVFIGRRSENHIVLEADNISRNHAAIERRKGTYFVRDLASANGTHVNGLRVELAPLNEGDRLRIGDFMITISLHNEDCILNFKQIVK